MTVTLNTGAGAPDKVEAPAGHDAKMAAAFDAAQGAAVSPPVEAPTPERPAWLPAEFTTAEDFAAAYTEMAKKQAPAADPPVEPVAEAVTEAAAKETVAKAGLDFGALQAEFARDGKVGDATYTALEKAGIPRAMVDAYVEGQTAVAASVRTDVFSAIGGEENFTAMAGWASKSLPEADLDAYNAAIDSGDRGQMKLAAQGLFAQYTAANGQEPNLIQGGVTAVSGETFRSTAEMTKAMSDPRYARDPAYRADVAARLARSSIF